MPRYRVIFPWTLLLVFSPLWCQGGPASTIRQNTLGFCSPAVADVHGSVTITCHGSDTELLKQLLTKTSSILNQMRSKDIVEISATLDQLVDTNPIESYYKALNAFARRIYFEGVENDPSKEVASFGKDGHPTPIFYDRWSSNAVKARVKALSQFGSYLKILAQREGVYLQRDSIVDRAEASVSEITPNSFADDRQAEYNESIAALLGTLQNADLGLARTILAGEPAATRVLNLLKSDFAIAHSELNTEMAQLIAMRVYEYNTHRDQMNRDQRHAALADVSLISDQYAALRDSNPIDRWLDGITEGYRELIQAAKSSRSTQHKAILASKLNATATRVEAAASAIRDFEANLNPR